MPPLHKLVVDYLRGQAEKKAKQVEVMKDLSAYLKGEFAKRDEVAAKVSVFFGFLPAISVNKKKKTRRL